MLNNEKKKKKIHGAALTIMTIYNDSLVGKRVNVWREKLVGSVEADIVKTLKMAQFTALMSLIDAGPITTALIYARKLN